MKREQQGSDGIFHVIPCDQDFACIFLFSNATNTQRDLEIMQLFQSLSLKNDRGNFLVIKKDINFSHSLSTDMFTLIMKNIFSNH